MTAQQCTLIKCILSSEKNVAVPYCIYSYGNAGLSLSFEAAIANGDSPVTSHKNF